MTLDEVIAYALEGAPPEERRGVIFDAASRPQPILILDGDDDDGRRRRPTRLDPAAVMLTCANCGARMDERKCKLICRCGYFLSCSDYY